MIQELIFAVLMAVLTAYIIYRLVSIYRKRKLLKNIDKKIEKQEKIYFIDGKEIDISALIKDEMEKVK